MLTPKNKNILLWCTGIVAALVCLVISFPTLLFKFYPYSIVLIALYVAVTVIFTVMYFVLKKKVFKIASFALYSIPPSVLIIILISIQAGWIAYP